MNLTQTVSALSAPKLDSKAVVAPPLKPAENKVSHLHEGVIALHIIKCVRYNLQPFVVAYPLFRPAFPLGNGTIPAKNQQYL
jgi:hypothetical protein